MAKLPAGSSKKNYVTDKKTGKPLSMNTKNPQEAGVGSVAKIAIKLGSKVVKKVVKSATAKPEVKANARALKAANKDVAIKYKKGFNEKNYSGRNESKPKQVAKNKTRANNPKASMTSSSSYKEAKGAYNAFLKKNPEVAKKVDPNPKFGPNISRSEKEMKRLSKLNKNTK
jgi:hypothetical protein